MLAHRIIPSILCRGRQQVKGKQFNSWRSVGLAAQAVRVHQARGVDEVALLDVGATPEGRGPDLSLVEELSDVMFAPLAVGGGIRSVEDVRALLKAGADKVVIGTQFIREPTFVRELADTVGSQAIVVSVDFRAVEYPDGRKLLCAFTECGRSQIFAPGSTSPMCPRTLAVKAKEYGAGEILLTCIDREGTMDGYALPIIEFVSKAVDIPVIAHGGCRDYEDMVDAIHAGASAVAAGALFQFTDSTPRGAAQALREYGIEVRL